MKTYRVTYRGNASRFQNFETVVMANSKREAVETVYQQRLYENYFPQDDGTILDCDGNELAGPDDTMIEYDGGYFLAIDPEKIFIGAFGQKYTLDVLPREDVEYSIREAEANPRALFSELFDAAVWMQGYKVTAYMNVSTGEVEVFGFLGNTRLQQEAHLVELVNIAYPYDEGLSVEDLLSPEEIAALDPDEDVWSHINDLDDLDERIKDAYVYHFESFDWDRIHDRLNEIYR